MNHIRKEAWVGAVAVMELPPPPPAKDKIMTPQQVKKLLDTIETHHIKLFAILAMHTLSRKTAILQLKWEQVDMKNRIIDYNPPGRFETKKRRVPVVINDILYAELENAVKLRESEYVIEFGSKRIYEIRRAFERWVIKAGFIGADKKPWVTPHILRHTGASILAANNVPIEQIAELLGDSIETTRKHYVKYQPEYLRNATTKLGALYA